MIAIHEQLADLTLKLCQINSPTGMERAVANFIEEWCKKNVQAQLVRIGNAIIVEVGTGPVIALMGHIDTVSPSPNQPTKQTQDRIFGCGASDMKGGVAVMLYTLSELSKTSPPFTLRCIFYDKEEGPYAQNGLALLENHLKDISLAICLEPTDNEIHAGCVGSIQAQITFQGRRAHSARPWQGENAIYQALPLLNTLAQHKPLEITIQGLSFYEVIHPTIIQAGIGRNVIPDEISINVNYRFSPAKSTQEASQELIALVGSHGKCLIYDEAPSAEPCHQHPWITAWTQVIRLPIKAKQAWTDVGRLATLHVAAINFGPGETNQAHQAEESILIDNLVVAYQSIQHLLQVIRRSVHHTK